jgi:hypothetical protein
MKYKIFKWYAIVLGVLILFSACGKKKSGFLLFPPDLLKDSNGVPLPDDISGNPGGNVQQEIPNHGPVIISGVLKVEMRDESIVSLTDAGLSSSDIGNIRINLVAPNASEVARVGVDNDGNFIFDLNDLQNNNYRILINDGYGLAYAYVDFSFIYDPTQNPNVRSGLELIAKRVYYTSGPAVISGLVINPGFNQDGVNINSGGLSGITVCLYDANQTQIACEQTGSDGSFTFNGSDNSILDNLPNGNYFVVVDGGSLTISGQGFSNAQTMIHFVFQGNDQTVPTSVNAGQLNVVWQAPTESDAQITAVVVNGAIEGDDLTQFTVRLKDENGNIIGTTSPNSSGLVQFSRRLSNGIYYLEVSRNNFTTRNKTFSFVAHAAGGTRVVNLTSEPIIMVANPSQITGMISSGSIAPIPGARINFRPDNTQPPKNLAYLLNDERIGNLIRSWILQACPTWNGTVEGTLACNCAPNCNYQTWAIKEYDYNPSIHKLFMTAVAGKWRYYVSAPGYNNSPEDVIILNGQSEERNVALSSTTRRSRIKGISITLDTLVNGNKNAYPSAPGYTSRHPLTGLFVVLVTINDGSNNYALVTITDSTGSYDFNGNAKVVQLPAGLTEEQKVGYAIQQFASAPTLASSSIVGVDPTTTIQKVTESGTDYYFFKQGAYSIFIVDPLDHISSGVYQADNSNVAQDTLNSGVVLNVTSVLAHKPRRKLSGTVTDAFSTTPVQGATAQLRKRVNGNLVAVYKDYDIISTITRLSDSAHELVSDQTTNANGYYEFKNIDPGDYVVIISKNGYEDQVIEITVPWNGDAVANSNIVPNTGRGNLEGRVMLAGGHPFTGTYAIELVHPITGVRPTTGVQPASLTSGPAIWSGTSQYNIFSVNAGQWKVRFTSAGYKSVEGLVNIPANGTAVFDIITAIPDSQGPANIRGVVRNAFNNKPVRGLTVRIRPGINVTSGPYALDANNQTIPAVMTDSNGNYLIPNVPAGNYTLEVSGTGTANGITEEYITTYRTVISAGTSTPASQDVLISPKLAQDEIRIVLQWNTNDPRDLDSHFEFGNKDCRISGTLPYKHRCQVSWKWKKPNSQWDDSFSGLNLGDASLDYDVITGYGPETVTVKGSIWTFTGPNANRLGYSVFNWSQRYYSNKTIKDAQAVVRVYRHNGLVRSYVAGSGQVNLWWNLFCINKTTKAIIDAGQPGCSETDFIDYQDYWDGKCDNNNPSDTSCHY